MTDLARIIRIYDETPRFEIEDAPHRWEGAPPIELYVPEVDHDAIARFHGMPPSTSFREKVANLKNPEALSSDEPLKLDWVSSADVNYSKANPGSVKFFQLAAIGVAITSDSQIVVGIRGGEVNPERRLQHASGLYGMAPGGSLTFKPAYTIDPITDVVLDEFNEELGHFPCRPGGIEGVFDTQRPAPGPTGIKFVSSLHVDVPFARLRQLNDDYNSDFERITGELGDAKKARTELIKRHPEYPHDGWEHNHLVGIPNTLEGIEAFLKETKEAGLLSGICAGGLMVYREAMARAHKI